MSDDLSKVNKTLYGSQDAIPFNMGANGEVHRVDSGRVDPNLTHYVGSEAAKELRDIIEEISIYLIEESKRLPSGERLELANAHTTQWKSQLDHILGLLHR